MALKRNLITVAAVLVLFSINSCERNDYELLDPGQAGKFTLFTSADGLPGNEVLDIELDSRDNLWVNFAGKGTAKYSNDTWTFYRQTNSSIIDDSATAIAESADGSVIIGTANGISFINTSGEWTSYVDPVNTMSVTSIKVARNGWVWVGTHDQGFYVNKGSGFEKVLSPLYSRINAIAEGPGGNIFIGTENGILKWDGASYTPITKANGLPHNRVSAFHFDRKNRMWIGTNGGKTASWIDNTGMHQLNLMTGADSLTITDIKEDRKGNIWFATHRNGLIKFNGVYTQPVKEFNGFPENYINCIGEDKKGNLWFGLKSKGLVRYTLPIE
jgi:ligand-binding sensor domain-containing protein